MKKNLIMLFVLIGFVGCSRLDVAYDLAPRMIANNLDDNFDFSSERYDQVKKMLTEDFKNNKSLLKSEVLVRIDEMLAVADSKELNEAQVEQFFQSVKKTQTKIIQSFGPSFKEVVMKMTTEELENVKKETNERHKKAEARLLEKDKFKEKAHTGFERNMETLFDEVTPEQKQMYADFIERNYEYFKLQLQHRKGYLKKFEETFSDKPKLIDLVMKYYASDDSIRPPEQLKMIGAFNKDMFATTVKLWATLTPAQRAEYKKSLTEIRNDVSALK